MSLVIMYQTNVIVPDSLKVKKLSIDLPCIVLEHKAL